jgi:putative ABC transport system permease protein
VLRRDLAAAEPLSLAAFVLGLAALAALIVWQAGDVRLGVYALGGFFAALLACAVAGYAMIRLVSRARGVASGPWRYGLANLRRRTWGSLVQIMALGLGLMAMLMLTLVRTELITKWQEKMPPDMPNRFAINIQTDQLPDVKAYFDSIRLSTPDLYPMVRGRLTEIAGKPVKAASYTDERAKRLAEREFNLSWSEELKSDNEVVAGKFWSPGVTEPQVLRGGGPGEDPRHQARRHAHLRDRRQRLHREGHQPAQGGLGLVQAELLRGRRARRSCGAIPRAGSRASTSSRGTTPKVAELVRRFPNVSVIDLTALMQQFQRITDQVSRAVEFVFLFAIAAGLVVLFAAITSTQDERVFEGADPADIGREPAPDDDPAARRVPRDRPSRRHHRRRRRRRARHGAFDKVLGVPYEFHWMLPTMGLLIGGLGVALAGLIGTRRAVSSPPLQTLREVT